MDKIASEDFRLTQTQTNQPYWKLNSKYHGNRQMRNRTLNKSRRELFPCASAGKMIKSNEDKSQSTPELNSISSSIGNESNIGIAMLEVPIQEACFPDLVSSYLEDELGLDSTDSIPDSLLSEDLFMDVSPLHVDSISDISCLTNSLSYVSSLTLSSHGDSSPSSNSTLENLISTDMVSNESAPADLRQPDTMQSQDEFVMSSPSESDDAIAINNGTYENNESLSSVVLRNLLILLDMDLKEFHQSVTDLHQEIQELQSDCENANRDQATADLGSSDFTESPELPSDADTLMYEDEWRLRIEPWLNRSPSSQGSDMEANNIITTNFSDLLPSGFKASSKLSRFVKTYCIIVIVECGLLECYQSEMGMGESNYGSSYPLLSI
jgi:hypothetical protein